jgi:hypothetical protein
MVEVSASGFPSKCLGNLSLGQKNRKGQTLWFDPLKLDPLKPDLFEDDPFKIWPLAKESKRKPAVASLLR